MSEKFTTKWFYASKGYFKSKKGLFKNKTKEVYSDRYVDIEEYANLLSQTYNDFDKEGYDVVNVIPITVGQTESSVALESKFEGKSDFSITRGAVVVGKKR